MDAVLLYVLNIRDAAQRDSLNTHSSAVVKFQCRQFPCGPRDIRLFACLLPPNLQSKSNEWSRRSIAAASSLRNDNSGARDVNTGELLLLPGRSLCCHNNQSCEHCINKD